MLCVKNACENKVVEIGRNRYLARIQWNIQVYMMNWLTCQTQIINFMDLLLFSLKIIYIKKILLHYYEPFLF